MQLRERGLDLTAENLKCIAETQMTVLQTGKKNLHKHKDVQTSNFLCRRCLIGQGHTQSAELD